MTLENQKTWLITGVAGFIGSNLLEALLKSGHKVVGIDNFSTGFKANLNSVLAQCTDAQSNNFTFHEGDIRDFALCQKLTQGIDIILHQAALGSVPRSIATPEHTHDNNVNGTFNMLLAARNNQVSTFIYASSSSVYGDSPELPKKEHHRGNLLSPYALSKSIKEGYAEIFARCYGLKTIGIRYFNVFGPRQNILGPYAAVIPTWIKSVLNNEPCHINGDGMTSRDFTYVDNVVHMNMLAANASKDVASPAIYNVAAGQQTTLNELHALIVASAQPVSKPQLIYRGFREGDIRHSLADITRAQEELGYAPLVSIQEGIEKTVNWFKNNPQTAS